MSISKLILRKEHFGGIFIDTGLGKVVFLDSREYLSKKGALEQEKKNGAWVHFYDASENRHPLLSDAASSPLDLYLELTKRCNGNCLDCYMDANPSEPASLEMPFETIKTTIRQFAETGGYYVRLTGGEPTMRKDFFEIADLIHREGLICSINSNGYYADGKLEKILKAGIDDIRISLDGPEEINDSIRGKGAFRKAMRTLVKIATHNKSPKISVPLAINVVLMKSNKDYIEKMIELAQGFGAKISFGLLRVSGRAELEEMLSPQEIAETTFQVQQIRKKLGLPKGQVRINYDILCENEENNSFAPYPFDNSKCPIGTRGMFVEAGGQVSPCGFLSTFERWRGEKVQENTLMDLWRHSKVLNEARAVVRPGCQTCAYHKAKCNGGCPMMAFVAEGDLDGKDPYCIRDIGKTVY